MPKFVQLYYRYIFQPGAEIAVAKRKKGNVVESVG